MNVVYAVITLIFFTQKSWSLNPVLLVPGDGGSIIMAKNIESPPHYICGFRHNWFVLWLNLFYITPLTLNCFVNTIKLEYDPIKRTTSPPHFCETKVDGFGTSDSVEYFSCFKVKSTSYFYYLIEDLVNKLGYVRNENIRGAPYDFRKAPNEMGSLMVDLKNLIEDMYKKSSNNSVVVIAHSLGNNYIIRLLNGMTQQWKDTYIKQFISISPPYAGAVDALQTVLSGNNEHIPLLSPLELRNALSTWPSTYYLMPVPEMWSTGDIVSTDKGNYTVNNLPKLLRDSKIQFAEDHLKDISKIVEKPKAPNVKVHCIYSNNVPTPEFLDYRGGIFPDNTPIIKMGPGDGTVNLKSLKHCTKWENDQTKQVTTDIISNVRHLEIMRDIRLLDLIINYIKDTNYYLSGNNL